MNQVTTYCGRSKLDLTRSQSDDLIVQAAASKPFVVADWHSGEPIVYGVGATAWAATNMARLSEAPKTSELCSRVIGESLVWQGPSGRRVTIEHLLTIDD